MPIAMWKCMLKLAIPGSEQDTVETNSDKMDNGSEVDQRDRCINLPQSY